MLRRCVSAAAVLFVLCGFVVAETYNGVITKLDKSSVTVMVRKKGEKKGEEKTFKVSKDLKVAKGKKGAEEASTKDITDGIEAATGKVKGVFAKIETEGDGDKEMVTKITLVGKKGKKKE